MAIPSKYSSVGLSTADRRKVLASGTPTKKPKPVEYIYRRINDKVNNAKEEMKEEIGMISMDSKKETNAISDYVSNSRSQGAFNPDDMDMDALQLVHKETFIVSGNMSYLIVDTNFILSHLNVLDELRSLAEEHRLRMVIPTTVVQELDGLKNSKTRREKGNSVTLNSIGQLARWANDWIYNCFAKKDPAVIGQSVDQRINRLAVKDDAILDCALYIQRENPKTLQVLLTNDKNLCTKALSNELLTVSYRDGMTAAKIASMISHENFHRFGRIQEHKVVRERRIEVPDYSTQRYEEVIYNEVLQLTKSMIHHCMKSSYGEELDLVRGYDISKATSLVDVADIISRFWRTVFNQYFGSTTYRSQFASRSPSLEYCYKPTDKETLDDFITFWSGFLEALIQKELEGPQITQMNTIMQRWTDMAVAHRKSK
ncbi:uncharacterized protein CXQ87_003246 [Candidozyma duobushaemuli]|uniref:PIN domain-containing protein n=2 Tax=Candidozyma TaxID=3303203 RepID=A0ABX8I7J0_9ASCO|nr:uncharacterized protein CXQ87_003246 [[Candida] duobushaemulonis]PVH15406.1 hypothetical protein CXQ87_003246 [[Candida] duobushaemulonis]QWU88630.1 hypothetical protein CA3LBN_002938 [[Candida] haemuloni]